MDNQQKLLAKLGLKPDAAASILHSPNGYLELIPLGGTVTLETLSDLAPIDWLQAFYVSRAVLQTELKLLAKCLSKNGQLWICWPKKLSGADSDLSDILVRQAGLDNGLVDVKIASIDNHWSALKFVYRLVDR